MDASLAIRRDELTLRYRPPEAPLNLAFGRAGLPFADWRVKARAVLADLLAVRRPGPARVRESRSTRYGGVTFLAAGLNAPRPLTLHYGELDAPGPANASASFNESVPDSTG